MIRVLATGVVLLGFAARAGAGPDTRPATQPDSPKEVLKAQDAAARSGNLDADLAFYQADGEQQKKLAHAIAVGDVAIAKLEAAVTKKFGMESAAAVVQAAGSESGTAVESASEKVDGERAVVQFRDLKSSVAMVRADGKWKISLNAWVQDAKHQQVDQLIAAVEKLATDLDHLTALVETDKFRSGEGVRDRVQRMHDQLLGSGHP